MTRYISLATEDELSEAVGLRLIKEHAPFLEVNLLLRKGGNGYLRSKINNFRKMAQINPLLLITDLDSEVCPPSLIAKWLEPGNIPSGLLFRVAVHEIESWLLADHAGIKRLLGKSAKLPSNPDNENKPKRLLLSIAKHSSRDVRRDLVAEKGANACQGLGYNLRLCNFVHNEWNPEMAAERSESLNRARIDLRKLAMET